MGQHGTGLQYVVVVQFSAHRPCRPLADGRGYEPPHDGVRRVSSRTFCRIGVASQREPLGLWSEGGTHQPSGMEPFLLLFDHG